MTEPELIAAAKAGNQDAFTELYRSHLVGVKVVARAMLKTSDVEDVCQDTFLKAFTRLDDFTGGSKFSTWLYRLTVNECLTVLRRHSQATNGDCNVVPFGDWHEATLTDVRAPKEINASMARLDVDKLLRHLSPRQREIVEMAYLDDIDDGDIAKVLGRSIGSVKSTLHNAKKRISACISEP
jgi:RNA polymerase sigma-70 factor, ECF subfamily